MRNKLLLLVLPISLHLSIPPAKGADLLDAVDSEIYWSLAEIEQSPPALIPLLVARVAAEAERETIDKHIADLASPEFAVRTRAMAELSRMGFHARPALEEAAESDNPEVAAAVKQLLSKVGRTADDSRMHRLMAIRTLGELEAEEAVPHLKKLADSKEPFVADYVSRALAEIQKGGFIPARPDPAALA